jgi:ribosomal-protein-alanine N-acetyltransferase
MELKTKRLILRDIEAEDADSIRENINNIKVSRYLLTVPSPYTRKDAKWWVNHCKEQQNKKPRTSYELGIVMRPNKEVIGGVGLSKVERYQGTAEAGYWLGEKYWRKGIMTEAVSKVIDFAFYKLKLRKIKIPIFVENEASNGLARKLGAKLEGVFKKQCRVKSTGKIHDENVYGLLKENWKNKK